jgi:hypothetical protein
MLGHHYASILYVSSQAEMLLPSQQLQREAGSRQSRIESTTVDEPMLDGASNVIFIDARLGHWL